MTVAELIAKLQEMPADAEIVYYEPPGYYASTHASLVDLLPGEENWAGAMQPLERNHESLDGLDDDAWDDAWEALQARAKKCVCIGNPYG